jgi:uncharacterized membrane protein
MSRARSIVLIDTLSALAMTAWVGGHAALGAFAARIAFQELPREMAAQTMTRVFREFDRLMWVAIVLVVACALLGVILRGGAFRSQVRLGVELGLCALGLFEVLYVHPGIETLYQAGRTLDPAFAALHRLSERCAHGEVLLVVVIFALRAATAKEER